MISVPLTQQTLANMLGHAARRAVTVAAGILQKRSLITYDSRESPTIEESDADLKLPPARCYKKLDEQFRQMYQAKESK